ncbi:MAG TPA: aconitate hydratase [Gammaproteobacteria bacterium]|nr:aconitate hydratase [Gammaproteobacteria bacterium]
MAHNVAQKLIAAHLVEGEMKIGEEIGLKIDQTLAQDATGTMVMLECEAMNLPRTKAEVSVQYVDHNLLQTDFKNADDHIFLRSACQKFGVWFSKPGNGVSHPVHMERFGIPGKTLVGSDSHTCAAGSLGMLAMGAGGIEVAMAMTGLPIHINMPKIWGVRLVGQLPDWVSAKDIILELLRRHNVKGGLGKIIEYYGPGLKQLSAMDRHVIANMGAELGATASVFPSDKITLEFLKQQDRAEDWVELLADKNAKYDEYTEIDLSQLEPLIALPSSPGNVVPVREVAGREIYQVMIGSSANPGMRDFAVPAMMVDGKQISDKVSFDINPTSRQILENLIEHKYLEKLVRAGGRIHQAGCNGCIGMGQAPATHKISLRTVPRNFPGRSGTQDDLVYLCGPETAAASALMGVITDPRTLNMAYPKFKEPKKIKINTLMLVEPPRDGSKIQLEKGPNIKPLPHFGELKSNISGPVLLKVGDNISTDTILPAGAEVLPFRSNIPAISDFVFFQLDKTYPERTKPHQKSGSFIVGGENYGQGSSREHAAIAPRYLGVEAVIAKSFARIHSQNLVAFGIVPLYFKNPKEYDDIQQGDILELSHIREAVQKGRDITVFNKTRNKSYLCEHHMSPRQIDVLLAGGLINTVKGKH